MAMIFFLEFSLVWVQISLVSLPFLFRLSNALNSDSFLTSLRGKPRIQNIFDVPAFSGTGVTSILPFPSPTTTVIGDDQNKRASCYVGTKRGKLKQVSMSISHSNSMDEPDSIHVHDLHDTNGKKLKPYPIFSMENVPKSCNVEAFDLLTGGGDRFITVWETINDVQNRASASANEKNWEVKTQLGPHTGWVKGLAYHSTRHGVMIFSIGCNCIEVWNGDYTHRCKLKIESSVEMGSTLSSDLLCLVTYGCHAGNNDGDREELACLLAGGVDGRLHRWVLDGSSFVTSGVTSAHDGRVNGILVCKGLNVLISIGNDACLSCRSISSDSFEDWKVTTLNLENLDMFKNDVSTDGSSSIKITALSILKEDSNKAIVSVGTSRGKVMLVQINRSTNNLKMSLLGDNIVQFENEKRIIYALGSFETLDSNSECSFKVIIGHADGLSIWNAMSLL